MRPSLLSCALCLSAAALQAADGPALEIGDPAPAFRPASFVLGDPFPHLEEGTVYVVEFSGVSCGPCIAAIPHLEELKKKHPSVRFVAVFTEPAEEVREFLDDAGKRMTASVVSDPDGKMFRDWLLQAGFVGVPTIFVVGPDRRIAWIGHADEIDGPLDHVAKGEPLDHMERVRATVAQLAAFRSKAADERWTEAHRHNSEDITRLINDGKLAEAVEAVDEALSEYRDLADVVEVLRERKLTLLAEIPGRRDEARELAFAIAADAYGGDEAGGVAGTLLTYQEHAIPENALADLPRLALVLLEDSAPAAAEPGVDDYVDAGMRRRNHFSARARAYHLLRRRDEALDAIGEAIRVTDDVLRRLREDGAAEWQIRLWSSVAEQLAARKSKYESP